MQIGGAALVRPWHSTLESLQALGRNQDASLGHYYYLLPALNDPRHSVTCLCCQLPSIPIAPSHSPATTRLTYPSSRIPTRPACNVFDVKTLLSSLVVARLTLLCVPIPTSGRLRSPPPPLSSTLGCAPQHSSLDTYTPPLQPWPSLRTSPFHFYFSPVARTHPTD
jgi:hypothetical protein